ncbi:MATE efflux family protein [Desulfovibrio sp. X2]|uniref:MATE family efflux transporter n=1 Tax=Desulfovibrio sp. X2 TaxID=941449 RepID=UPI0003589D3D|nr:MATE family efflux transporter [Desulfovibrio sp. X2]EPR38684.1 MATE efflux family protein [Desulfovibrio sp. X2]
MRDAAGTERKGAAHGSGEGSRDLGDSAGRAASGVPCGLDLTRGAVGPLVRRIAVPAGVGYLFHTMFNVVDTWYAGRISTTALAALSLSFPAFFLILALGSGMATGATALIGNALGAGNREEASGFAAQGIVFGVLVSGLLTGVSLAAARPLFVSLGAHGAYLQACLDYMVPIFWCSCLFIGIYQLNAGLQSQGDTRSIRNFLIMGSLLNVGLDPLFIHGFTVRGVGLPGFGVPGIAWATVAVQAMGCVYLSARLARSGLMDGLRARDFLPRFATIRAIAGQGLPASLDYLCVGLGIYIIIWFISGYGEAAVASYGIATRIEQIVLLPSIALSVATLAMTAQNMGARRFERVLETLGTTLRGGFYIMCLGTAFVVLGAAPLMRLFTDDPAVVAAGAGYLRIEGFALYGYVLLYVHISALQGAKRPVFAVWMGLFRQIAAPVPVFYLATRVIGMGLTGLWWSIFAIVWFSAVAAFFISRRILARTIRESAARAREEPGIETGTETGTETGAEAEAGAGAEAREENA